MVTVNTAANIYGIKAIDERIGRIARSDHRRSTLRVSIGTTLGAAVRALVREVLRRCPVITGRLYRSFRLRVASDHIELRFTARYASDPNAHSPRNRRYFDRGLAAGVTAANRVASSQASRSGFRLQFRPLRPKPERGSQVYRNVGWWSKETWGLVARVNYQAVPVMQGV